MDNDILQYNKYISFFTDLYNYTMDSSYKILSTEYKPIVKKQSLFKSYTISEDMQRYGDFNKLAENFEKIRQTFLFEKCQLEEILSFASMWQFCQFVRYAEKTVFYDNKIENSLYVDSDMMDVKARMFVIKTNDTEIAFKLEKVEDTINKVEFKTITLNIKRLYGKNMTNIFTIVNEDIKCNDSSDLYLINTVNNILYKEMINTIMKSTNRIIDIHHQLIFG